MPTAKGDWEGVSTNCMVEIPSYALPIKFLCQVRNSLSKVTGKKILLMYDS